MKLIKTEDKIDFWSCWCGAKFFSPVEEREKYEARFKNCFGDHWKVWRILVMVVLAGLVGFILVSELILFVASYAQ